MLLTIARCAYGTARERIGETQRSWLPRAVQRHVILLFYPWRQSAEGNSFCLRIRKPTAENLLQGQQQGQKQFRRLQ